VDRDSVEYLAMIAMDEQWVVLFVQSNLHDGVHHYVRDLNSLGPLHFDDTMAYPTERHKVDELGREVVVDEGTARG
jgi:hypothetical protein